MADDCLQRQLQEINAVEATFPEAGALSFTSAEAAAVENLKSVDEVGPHGHAEQELPGISGTVNLLDCKLSGQAVGLQFRLPTKYPLQKPWLQVLCAAGTQPS